jgi:hypothetical protein
LDENNLMENNSMEPECIKVLNNKCKMGGGDVGPQ